MSKVKNQRVVQRRIQVESEMTLCLLCLYAKTGDWLKMPQTPMPFSPQPHERLLTIYIKSVSILLLLWPGTVQLERKILYDQSASILSV